MSYEDREKRIQKRIEDKDLNIRVSWAINNAVDIANAIIKEDHGREQVQKGIRDWSEWFLRYYEELRHQEAKKIVENDDNEQAL